MTPERQTLCRQVASLIALSQSCNPNEAASADAKAKEFIRKHGVGFAEVRPFLNDVAMQVANRFWNTQTRPAEPPPAGPSASERPRSDRSPFSHIYAEQVRREEAETLRRAQEARDFEEALAEERRRQDWTGFSHRTSDPFNFTFRNFYGTGFYGGVDWARPEPPGTYFTDRGTRIRVEDLDNGRLAALLIECEHHRDRIRQKENEAHDFIDAGDYISASGVIALLQRRQAPQTAEVQAALLAEAKRRHLRDPAGRW